MNKLNNKTKYRGLALLLAAGFIASSASVAVVSCKTGISLEKVLERRRDTKTLTLTYQSPVEGWNTAHTQLAGDGEFLANLYAGALGIDEYGRTYGDVFESGYADSNGNSPYVGNPAPKKSESSEHESSQIVSDEQDVEFNASLWQYKIRSNAKWFDKTGRVLRNIKASDFENTAKYILNSSKGSDLSMLWESFILNATELSELFSAYVALPNENGISETEENKLIDAAWKKALEKVSKVGEVFYKLKNKEGQVVESKEPVKILKPGFGLHINEEEGTVKFELTKPSTYFETVLTYGCFSPIYDAHVDQLANSPIDAFSGAYLPKSIDGDDKTLVKNDNYHFAEKTSISTINWKYLAKPTSSKAREMFEAGEVDSFVVKQTDEAGWNKYVGEDSLNPKFTGVYSTDPVKDFSFGIYYNFANATGDSKAIAASKVLQLKETREFLATSINRSDFVKYYSEKFDTVDQKVSKNVRNIYTSPNFAINPSADLGDGEIGSKDYVEYVKEAVERLTNKKVKSKDLEEGHDPFLNNSISLSNQDQSELIAAINKHIKDNGIETKEGKVELIWALSPDNSVTNPYLVQMFDNFNKIEGNPLKIVAPVSNTHKDWTALQRSGKFDLASSGWGPDYADPYSYLATYKINGDYAAYHGFRRLTDDLGENGDKKLKTSATDSFMEIVNSYDTKVKKIDTNEGDTTDDRYNNFAEEEAKAIYIDFLFTPFYNRNQYKEYKVSYIKPYTYGHAIYGLSTARTFTQQKSSSIATKEEYDYQINQYKLVKEAIDTRPSTGKANNVLFKTPTKSTTV
ncbi:oligopeptide ABC transporter substrate-binding protein [Entomoplasma ellychniae]|uniref:Oligopeptide ABC transporter substrate-binding protein n=1 Tax=Entomoplasma ellychniae TaxID=2114 RepID=A0A8E2QVE0_9MOLU|nr:ABC transporter substrate-binding protein [Entomoplasma ellychniae]PPE04392.1 oligopeptide ABC transporter substrate-binding protein [Entomoplasma ellychniae]